MTAGSLRQSLLDAHDIDAAADFLVHPHSRAAGAAAHRLFAAQLELERRVTGQLRDDGAWRLIFTVVPGEVARLVIDDALESPVDADATLGDKPCDELRVMHTS